MRRGLHSPSDARFETGAALSGHEARATVFTLKQAQEIPLAGDVYTARVRGPQTELLYNFGYSELRAMSVPGGAQTSAVQFPGGDFSIYEWHVRPDGNVSYLFSPDDMAYALR